MAPPLLSYFEASEQVQLYLQGFANPDAAANPSASPIEVVSLHQAAGRVLASGIRADRDQPPFVRSTRDGFAGRAAEINTHQLLFLAGQVRAGESYSGVLGVGETWEIMTGAPVPEGADCVFMVEHAEQASNFVRLVAPRLVQPGENIVPRAAEAHAGDLLVPPGVRIGPAQIAMAAQCGYSELAVVGRPRVAILSTGDELVTIEDIPGASQIRNSNSPMLATLVAAAGGEPVILPVARDNEADVDRALTAALALKPALLLITGGISAGRFDLVEDALTRLGGRFFFSGVAIQPGKPVTFGQVPASDETSANTSIGRPVPFFALPGNPISSAVTFHLFAAPVLAALGEDSGPQPRFALAQLSATWHGKAGLTRFLPAWCDFGPASHAAPEVRLVPWQGSGDIAAFARSNCFVVIPAEAHEIPEGSLVQILLS